MGEEGRDHERRPEGSEANAAARARIGEPLNAKWTITALLGVGGMATVYAAQHRNGARAAVKVLHAELARDPSLRERFLREGKIANRIEHPARVRVLDDDKSDLGEPFLVLELLEGEPLDRHLARRGGTLPPEEAFALLEPVLALLERCHAEQIVHRDIKPANLFLTASGEVKVLDFGIARLREGQGGADATRQGTALGTPSFMAPEQALGLGDVIDGRADLFSVGACLYTALSGARLHDTKNPTEAFVLAATRAAPSLAQVAPDLPAELVAFVDRALAFDRAQRFQDARSMRLELATLLAALRAGELRGGPGARASGLLVRAADVFEDEGPRSVGEERVQLAERVRTFWKHVGMFLAGVRQYGWSHREPERNLELAFEELGTALATLPALRFELTPYAFLWEGAAVWEPERAPFDRIPFRLFGDGLRKMAILPGVSEQELRDLLAVLMRDPTGGEAGEDDAVTGLWDRHFEHVVYLAIDSFAEGDAEERDAFARSCDEIAESAAQLSMIDKDLDEGTLEARALSHNLLLAMREAAETASSLAVDPVTRAALGAQLALSAERWTERYVDAFVEAYLEAARAGDLPHLAGALQEWATDQIALHNLPLVFGMYDAIRRGVLTRIPGPEGEALEQQIVDVMFPGHLVIAVIRQLASDARGADEREPARLEDTVSEGVARAVDTLWNDALFSTACASLEALRGTPVGDRLVAYLKKWVAGHEAELAALVERARVDVAGDLLRVALEGEGADVGEVVAAALRNPSPEVRAGAVAALPAERALGATELLQVLVEDPAPEVRSATLASVARHGVKALGPTLVRRIQSPGFHGLPLAERRQLLDTLAELSPARAESLALELLGKSQLLPSAEAEQSRVAAAQALGSLAASPAAVEALEAAAKNRWWNSAQVREAAARALSDIAARGAAPTSRRHEPETAR